MKACLIDISTKTMEHSMGMHVMLGYLMQAKGKTKTTVGKLAGNRSLVLSGKKDKMVGKLQAQYGLSLDETETIKQWNLL